MADMITIDLLPTLALGATILGTGGGGDPYIGRLMAEQAIRECGPVPLVAPEDVPDDAVLLLCGMMGAPAVIVEKLPSGTEIAQAITAVAQVTGRAVTHLVSLEAGGINSVVPVAAAARAGLPLVDADGMGRAFPELQMLLPTLEGISATPMALVDDKGNRLVIDTVDNRSAEAFARGATVQMGASASLAFYPLRGDQVARALVPKTMSLAIAIGRTLETARRAHDDPIDAVARVMQGRALFRGKVVDVLRRTAAGFNRGVATIEGMGADTGTTMTLDFQNEFLIARRGDRPIVTTPDLICLLDALSGEPVTAETLRYGRRVAAIGAPCFERWRSPEGLAIVGPGYFGYDYPYRPFSPDDESV